MAVRHIYLKFGSIPGYSPVCPNPTAARSIRYGRDCMRNMGHEDATIPAPEINTRTVSALVYPEYLDPAYPAPKHPGERLKIHVANADSGPHSLPIRPRGFEAGQIDWDEYRHLPVKRRATT